MRTRGLRTAALLAGTAVVAAGCGGGSGATPGGSSTVSPSASSPSIGGSAAPSPIPSGDRVFHGQILGTGLTCVRFIGSDGTNYALTGAGLSKKVRALAHSGYARPSLHAPPNRRMIAAVTVVGHVEPHAMNTCGFTTLVTSKITVGPVHPYTGPPTPPATA